MEDFMLDVTAEERAFYGDRLILLEGIIWEFLTCVTMIRRYQVSLGRADPVTSCQARIKRAGSMREKLRRQRRWYFIKQKLTGIAVLAFTAFAVWLLDGDATIAVLTVPLGMYLVFSREMLIMNNFYWQTKERRGKYGA